MISSNWENFKRYNTQQEWREMDTHVLGFGSSFLKGNLALYINIRCACVLTQKFCLEIYLKKITKDTIWTKIW